MYIIKLNNVKLIIFCRKFFPISVIILLWYKLSNILDTISVAASTIEIVTCVCEEISSVSCLKSFKILMTSRITCRSFSERFFTGLCRSPSAASRGSCRIVILSIMSRVLFQPIITSFFSFNGFWPGLSCYCIANSFFVATGLRWKCSTIVLIFFYNILLVTTPKSCTYY